MDAARLERRRVKEQMGRSVEFARLEVEFVTDDILQVMLYIDVRPEKETETAWLLALAVDAVAFEFDRAHPPFFASLGHSFSAAWSQLSARPVKKRMEAANLRDLLPFLGGSSDPS